uniref:acid phosphatase n=4 Tax=Braconinae TaxID=65225 RepID=A0A455LAT0_9HYME|nr:venom acid phosphatase [Habrobracon hebetor]
MIRNYYGNFLGEIYSPSDIIARSTDFDRTKMSLQLVLAGIYPPAIAQRWNARMNWQPVVTSTVSEADDSLMIPEECPQFLEEYERVKKLPEVKARLNEFSDFMWSAAELSGKRMETAEDMYYLWHALMAEASMGLELPAWTKDMFPYGPLYNGTLMEYELRNYNDKLKRLNGGMLLKNITESMLESVAGLNKRKMHLLSGHESNIDGLLHVLGVYKPHAPEYSSAIFVELLEDKTEYYVRVQYYLGIPPVTVEQVIPGCTSPCPLSDFIRILGHLIPRDEELNCPKKKDNVANASVWKQLSEDLRRKIKNP